MLILTYYLFMIRCRTVFLFFKKTKKLCNLAQLQLIQNSLSILFSEKTTFTNFHQASTAYGGKVQKKKNNEKRIKIL